MRAKEFSDDLISSLAANGKRYEVKDPLCPGLRVIVQPSGAKSFAVRYSHGGAYKKLTLGAWPQIKLVETTAEKRARLERDPNSAAPDARSLYRAAMAAKATGTDPAAKKQEERRAANTNDDGDANLVERRWQNFLDKPAKSGKAKRASSRKRYESSFGPCLDKWRGRQVKSVTESECNDFLDAAEKRGPYAKASLYMILAGFFGWLERKGHIDKSPLKAMDKPPTGGKRKRALTDAELKIIWNGCKNADVFGRFVRMLLLTGQRRTEVAAMKFSEIHDNVWHIPGDKTKNHKEHLVPLSSQAVAIIEETPRIEKCDFVFTNTGEGHISGFSKGKAALDKLAPTEKAWRLHDCRKTVRTRAASMRVPLEVARKMLNQSSGGSSNEIDETYDLYEYLDERKAAFENWANALESIAANDGSNVVPIRA